MDKAGLSVILWIIFHLVTVGMCTPSFVKSTLIKNKFCSLAATIVYGVPASVLECAKQCKSDSNCHSFFYNAAGPCAGSTSLLYDDVGCSVDEGTKYYLSTGKNPFYSKTCLKQQLKNRQNQGLNGKL